MADMRLIVAGAGGRMGRALTRVISETPGAVLTGALEAPGSALLGKDAGVLAGLPENGIKLSADLRALSKDADRIWPVSLQPIWSKEDQDNTRACYRASGMFFGKPYFVTSARCWFEESAAATT